MENIYEFIKTSQTNYQKPIQLEDGWNWSMKEHLRLSFLYKHSQFDENNDSRNTRPFKNIVKPILNIQYRTEGFDVKDIEIYVNNPDKYYKSFLVKKFHEKWAKENKIDTFIDDTVESYVDYGGVLVRNTTQSRPEVIDMRSLSFCNQTNILENPFAILHTMSPSELRKYKEWGQEGATITIEELIALYKKENGDEPKEIEIYEIHGTLPSSWLNVEENESSDIVEKDIQQIQIVAFYQKPEGIEQGVVLFRKKEPKLPFKFLSRDKIYGRALGWGGIEELFEPQIWTNFGEVAIAEMLEQASKVLYKSDDLKFKTRNNLSNVRQGEVLQLQTGTDIAQLDTFPRNLATFNDSLERWQEQAQIMGAASEGMLQAESKSGVPFKLFEAQQMEARGMHHYRQGQIAVFIDEIYREWTLPHLSNEIANEQNFLTELSSDELMKVIDQMVENEANRFQIEKVLDGELVFPEEVADLKETTRIRLANRGSKWFVKILKDEMKEPLGISTNIAGKQKNLALLTDKVVNVLRQFISTPEIRQDPEMIKLLNTILESSGMSPIIYGASPQRQPALPQQQQGGGGTEPLKALGQAQLEATKL